MKFVTPGIAKWFFPHLIWEMKTSEKVIFLTFDDGPHPSITPQVLDILDNYQAKATFFCVGENVKKYPDVYQLILKKGHKTGNHGFYHLNGWKTPRQQYLDDVEKCSEFVDSHLFRPPYGRITFLQTGYLKINYRIIMWSVLTYDFDRNTSAEQCYGYGIRYGKPGSVVVFHDSEKAAKNMLNALPGFLKYFTDKGYSFKILQL